MDLHCTHSCTVHSHCTLHLHCSSVRALEVNTVSSQFFESEACPWAVNLWFHLQCTLHVQCTYAPEPCTFSALCSALRHSGCMLRCSRTLWAGTLYHICTMCSSSVVLCAKHCWSRKFFIKWIFSQWSPVTEMYWDERHRQPHMNPFINIMIYRDITVMVAYSEVSNQTTFFTNCT